jgi:hypothetical protein
MYTEKITDCLNIYNNIVLKGYFINSKYIPTIEDNTLFNNINIIPTDKTLLEIDFTTYYEGIIEQDSSRNFHCGEYALAYLHITNNNFKIGDRIRITESTENTNNKTNSLYPKHAKRFIQL